MNVPALGVVALYETAYFLPKVKFLAEHKSQLPTKLAIA